MMHALHRVTAFKVIGPYRLRVSFRDGIVREIDFQPVLAGSLFGPLRDLAVFNQVRLDPEVHTLVWPNGADFDPATLHDWPDLLPAMEERARSWESKAETLDQVRENLREGGSHTASVNPTVRKSSTISR